jgi:glycosyltransferase involved in cell wall biosynthesis
MKLKKFIPTVLKKPFWWLFKAPQHKVGGFVYATEIRGYLVLFLHRILPFKKKLQPVTLCVSNKNRSQALLQFLAASLQKANHKDLIYLSVFDCGSEDRIYLEQELNRLFGEKLIFKTEAIPFARSYAINQAVSRASTDLVFITDADISVPVDIVEKINFYARRNRVWFPITSAFINKEETITEWYTEGKGLTACNKKQFQSMGGYDESITNWGGEDNDFWIRCWENKLFPVRSKEKDLIHHWHPSVEGALKKW